MKNTSHLTAMPMRSSVAPMPHKAGKMGSDGPMGTTGSGAAGC
jgi:hypothetical protein